MQLEFLIPFFYIIYTPSTPKKADAVVKYIPPTTAPGVPSEPSLALNKATPSSSI